MFNNQYPAFDFKPCKIPYMYEPGILDILGIQRYQNDPKTNKVSMGQGISTQKNYRITLQRLVV